MRLTPRNVDRKLTDILVDYASEEKENLWFGRIKIEDADIPRKLVKDKNGFIISLYIGGDVDENPNFVEYLAIRHQILLGFNIPAFDRDNALTRNKLWEKAEELEKILSKQGFNVVLGPEDIPATDVRIILFTSYSQGSPSFLR